MSTKTFTIEGRGLKLDSAADVQEFIDTIAKMDELENVILSGNTFGVAACRALSEALAKKPLLKVRKPNRQREHQEDQDDSAGPFPHHTTCTGRFSNRVFPN